MNHMTNTNVSMWKRVFSRKEPQPEQVTKSVRCNKTMWEAIEKLAKEAGETPNAYIVLVLDQFLQLQAEEGKIQSPTVSTSKET